MEYRLIFRPSRATAIAVLAALACACPGAGAAAAAKRFDLETSDGVELATWYYAPPDEAKPIATVILVHDLDGSHETVEPLAAALQQAGYAVAVPDLRGHGASRPPGAAGRGPLRRSDLELIAAGSGGRLREQAGVRGDLETVYAFLAARGGPGVFAPDRLAVVGFGAGGLLATLWTTADWAWPPLASGPQGQKVGALVLVSPAWAAKGATIQPALATEVVKHEVPIMLLAGTADRDAIRLFEQLKRQRPKDWYDQRAGDDGSAKKAKDASLLLLQFSTPMSSEKLLDTGPATTVIRDFLKVALDDASR